MDETDKITVLMKLTFCCVETNMKQVQISEVIFTHGIYYEEKE